MKYFSRVNAPKGVIKSLSRVATLKSFETPLFNVRNNCVTLPTNTKEKILSDLEFMVCIYFLDEITVDELKSTLYSLKYSKFKFKKSIAIPEVLTTPNFHINLLLKLDPDKKNICINIKFSQMTISSHYAKKTVFINYHHVIEKIESIITTFNAL